MVSKHKDSFMFSSWKCALFNSTKPYSQKILALAVVLLLMQIGAMFGWTSPYGAKFAGNSTTIHVEQDSIEATWIASVLNIGRAAGGILGGLAVYFYGSKQAIIFTFLPIGAGWVILGIAQSVTWIIIGRLICGLGGGMMFSCYPLFVGEAALPSNRGTIGCLGFCGSPLTLLAASALGYYFDKEIFSLVLMIPWAIGITLYCIMPHSPHYLIQIGRVNAAKRALEWYRGSSDDLDLHLQEVQAYVAKYKETTFCEKLADFKKPHLRKALFIGLTAFMFMQFCGLNTVVFFMEEILKDAKVSIIEPGLATICINLIGCAFAIISAILIDRVGKKPLLLTSATGVTVTMIALGTYFLMLEDGVVDSTQSIQQLLPLIAITLFYATFALGLLAIPSVLLGELFPANIKSVSATLGSLTGGLFAFLSSSTFHPLAKYIEKFGVFYLHAAIAVLVIPFTLLILPETKGKSLQEIQDKLVRSKR